MSRRLLALLLCLAPAGVLSAQGWIDDDLVANGVTNLEAAVEAALADRGTGERLSLILLLTDGLHRSASRLPIVFYGEELVILARYRGEGSGPVVIELIEVPAVVKPVAVKRSSAGSGARRFGARFDGCRPGARGLRAGDGVRPHARAHRSRRAAKQSSGCRIRTNH